MIRCLIIYDQSYMTNMIFKKSDNALLFWLTIYDFFSKYNRTSVFKQLEIENEQAANFQNKIFIKFQKI